MTDESQAELSALRARVYGRSEVDPNDIARLVELETRSAPVPSEAPVLDEIAPSRGSSDEEGVRDSEVSAPEPARLVERRGILIATLILVAVGGMVAGSLAGESPVSEERATSSSTVTTAEPTPDFPEEFTASYLRVANWWNWDEFLFFGGSVDGAAIWVGTVGGRSEVCLVFDEGASATMLCNPAGQYPSSFEWVKTTEPSPGTYRLTLEQTGDVAWTFEPAS